MKLRDHPGISTWPPSWIAMAGSHEEKFLGESGILTSLSLSRIEPITTCYLTVEFDQELYMGTLLCKDPRVCRNLHDVLQNHIGKLIREIGDLDLSEPL